MDSYYPVGESNDLWGIDYSRYGVIITSLGGTEQGRIILGIKFVVRVKISNSGDRLKSFIIYALGYSLRQFSK